MKSQPAILVNGALAPAGPLDPAPVCIVNTTLDYLSYAAADSLRLPGHRHGILAPWADAYIEPGSQLYPIVSDPRISVFEYLTTWRTLEPRPGAYNFVELHRAFKRCHAIGVDFVLRSLAKSYVIGAALPVPDYIAAVANGTYAVYSNGVAVGVGAMFENDYVRGRWKALMAAIAHQFAASKTLIGVIGPDESSRSAWTGTGLPAGMSSTAIMNANSDMWRNDAALFGASRAMPCVNFVDGTETQAVTNANARTLQSWAVSQGMSLAVSDTFPLPQAMRQSLQAVYFQMPIPSMAVGTNVLVNVDHMSNIVAPGGDLWELERDNAIQTYRLGATITAWNPEPMSGPNIWAAQRAAIDATQGFRS